LNEYINAMPGSIWILARKTYRKNIYVKCLDSWVRVDKFRFADRSLV
jgi:hypothetical protein